MKAIACSLQLQDSDFIENFSNPTELFRIFNYPTHNSTFSEDSHGVGQHTDYGYLTILKQDHRMSGLQVKNINDTWIEAEPIKNTFLINIGDSLEFFTKGIYKATPHRVLQRRNATLSRLSFPYFFDPNFNAAMGRDRTYGDYLIQKVSKVFPQLAMNLPI